MVGTDPRRGGTTQVRTVIIPLRMTFADGSVFDARSDVREVVESPLFEATRFPGDLSALGRTQYGDAVQRAEFWSIARHDYHVLLGQPQIAPVVDLSVPASLGYTTTVPGIGLVGFVSYEWMAARIHELVNDGSVPPNSLPIIVTNLVGTTAGDAWHDVGDAHA